MQARQLLIEAASLLEKNENEQTRVLNLLEVFRDYVKKKTIPTTAKILATQVANLEATAKKIATQAKKPLFSEVLRQTKAPNANATANGRPNSTQDWVVVSKKNGKPTTALNKAKTLGPIQLVLALTSLSQDTPINLIAIRDKINDNYKAQGAKDLTAMSVKRSTKGNLMITLTSLTAKERVLKDIETLARVIPFSCILEDNT